MAKKFGSHFLRSPDTVPEKGTSNLSPSLNASAGNIRLSPSIQYDTYKQNEHNRQNFYNASANETTFETILSDEEIETKSDKNRFTPLSAFQKASPARNVFLDDMQMLPSSALNLQGQLGTPLDKTANNLFANRDSVFLPSKSYHHEGNTDSDSSSDSSAILLNKVSSNNQTNQNLKISNHSSDTKNYLSSESELSGDGFEHREYTESTSDGSIDAETKIQLQCLPYKTIYDGYYAIELDSNIKETDWVETSYNLKIQDDPENKVLYDRALLTIGLGLKSLPLINLVLTNNELMLEYYSGAEFKFDDAVTALKLDLLPTQFTEMDVINNFVEICLKNEIEFSESNILKDKVYDNFIYYCIALKYIGEELNSDIVKRFLSTGFVDDRLLKNGNWPVGLFNMGNTCYLNSLLQYYFAITPLKKYILDYKKPEFEEGQNELDLDVLRCQDFLLQIQKLYLDMINTKYKISVPSNELVYLTFAPRGGLGLVEGKVPDMDALEMTLDIGRQQDVTECMLNFIEQIDVTIMNEKKSLKSEITNELFNGKLSTSFTDILDAEIQGKSDQVENFTSLLIHLHNNPKNLYDAMDQFFSDDQQVMEMKEYGQVKKSIFIKDLPEILQVQLQRVEFDKHRLIPVKNNYQLEFPEQLFLDRYVKGGVDEVHLAQYKTLNQRLVFLQEKKKKLMKKARASSHGSQHLTLRSSISMTLKYLQSELYENSMHFDDAELKKTIKSLQGLKDHIDDEIAAVDLEIAEVTNLKYCHFDDFKKYEYTLFAVFMHRGEANYGHYWITIKDGEIWRKYNDEEVVEVENPKEQIFNFEKTNQETAYYLAYVRNDKISKLIQPLDRAVKEDPEKKMNI